MSTPPSTQPPSSTDALLETVVRRWRAAFDSIPDPIVLIDADYRLRRTNTAAVPVGDVRAVLGRRCHDVLFDCAEPCEGCPVGAASAEPASAEISPGDGRTWSVHASPLLTDDEVGDGPWTVCHHRDITQARRLQREVVILEKLAAIGELAGTVAHEINNPLTTILTFSQLLSRGVDSEDVLEMAADIEQAARRCQRIVASLLDFARTDGKAAVSPVDLGQITAESVRLLGIQHAGRGELEVRAVGLEDGPFWVEGIPDQLRSLVLNLLQNAIQAMQKRGTVTAGLQHTPGAVRLVVCDTGPGIPESIIHQIFEPFFTTKAANKGGTGLGLSIVRNVVRDHLGQITVANQPAGGACFTVVLPTSEIRATEETT